MIPPRRSRVLDRAIEARRQAAGRWPRLASRLGCVAVMLLIALTGAMTLHVVSVSKRSTSGPEMLRRALARRSAGAADGEGARSDSFVVAAAGAAADPAAGRARTERHPGAPHMDEAPVDYDALAAADQAREDAVRAAAEEVAPPPPSPSAQPRRQRRLVPPPHAAGARVVPEEDAQQPPPRPMPGEVPAAPAAAAAAGSGSGGGAEEVWTEVRQEAPVSGANPASPPSTASRSASQRPARSRSRLPSPSTLPADYDGFYGLDAIGAALAARPARRFHDNVYGRTIENAYKPDDRDANLLEPEEIDPWEGVVALPPTGRVVPDDAATARARAAHEAAASVAIVVMTAPRATVMNRDPVQQGYFRASFECYPERNTYARVPACEAPGVATRACVAAAAAACDDEPACVGFNGRGQLFEHVDGPTCDVPVRTTVLDGSRLAPDQGLYLKAPMPIVPVARRVTVPGGGAAPGDAWSTWWRLHFVDVVGHDIGQHAAAERGTPTTYEQKAAAAGLFRVCGADPGCAAFNYPYGWLKNTTAVSEMSVTRTLPDLMLYTKARPPPLDYVTATVTSLVDELGGGACDARGAFGGRVHLYVADTSKPELHALRDAPQSVDANPRIALRGPQADDYWFTAFAWLRRRYSHLPCVTFLPANAYPRLREDGQPPHGRGLPEWQADNRGRKMTRGQVVQTLDFVSALRAAAAASPAAHVLVSEDDNFFCNGTLAHLSASADVVSRFDPHWGALKVGNGGSGILFHGDVLPGLLTYLVTRRGSDNVDVSMWRYLWSGQHSDYLSATTWSAHRGLQSSFKLGFAPVWGRVRCGGELDYYWGYYRPCDYGNVGMAVAAAAKARSGGGDAAAAKPPALNETVADEPLRAFLKQWRCSVWSPGTVAAMPPK